MAHLEIFRATHKIEWSDDQINDLKKNYFYYLRHKDEAECRFKKNWYIIASKASQLKITSMKINKKCGMFLGCHVAERILSHIFKDVKRMSLRNHGYDFICNKGKKIEVKSSCLHKNKTYIFQIKYNKVADYFLLIGFDNINDLNPQHIWLIKSDEIINNKELNDYVSFRITNKLWCLSQFLKYELTYKLREAIECCSELKNQNI